MQPALRLYRMRNLRISGLTFRGAGQGAAVEKSHGVLIERCTFDGLARQYWGYGLAKAGVLGRHPERLRPRHLIPSALVVALGGGALLTMLDRRFAWIPALAGGAYAIATGLASWRFASKGNKQEARYLPAAFACIHLPAGAGFLLGLIRARMKQARDG